MEKRVPGDEPSRYHDPHLQRMVVKIKPGEFFATTLPYVITTVLGSCVAACIRDPVRGSAGMNHFMLPKQGASALAAGASASLRYGAFAMESLVNEFIKHGSARRDLEAKVFGGASVVDAIATDVGATNADFVVDYLANEGIRTIGSDLGGSAPRKVLFYVEDGRVLVKYLWRLTNTTIVRREIEYMRRIAYDQPTVELF